VTAGLPDATFWDRGSTYYQRRAYSSKFLIVSSGPDGELGIGRWDVPSTSLTALQLLLESQAAQATLARIGDVYQEPDPPGRRRRRSWKRRGWTTSPTTTSCRPAEGPSDEDDGHERRGLHAGRVAGRDPDHRHRQRRDPSHVLPAISHRQVSESARIVQAAIEGARDAAIRADAPRGIRLLPDPAFPGSATAENTPLAFNRIVPIEPAGEYDEGRVSIRLGPGPTIGGPALRIEESQVSPGGQANARTSWYWNVRVGDRIRIGASGHFYTVVGPVVDANPERFVNVGPPGPPVMSGAWASVGEPGSDVPLRGQRPRRQPEWAHRRGIRRRGQRRGWGGGRGERGRRLGQQ
jgi:hypothetical protein